MDGVPLIVCTRPRAELVCLVAQVSVTRYSITPVVPFFGVRFLIVMVARFPIQFLRGCRLSAPLLLMRCALLLPATRIMLVRARVRLWLRI